MGETMDEVAANIRDNWPGQPHHVHIHKGGEGDPLVVNIPGLEPREFPMPVHPEES